MGTILEKEGKATEAIDTYMEVCYQDLNGVFNCGTQNPEMLHKYPPFNLELSRLAPGVVSYMVKLLKKQNSSIGETKLLFFKMSKMLYKNFKLPLRPETAWEKLIKENTLILKELDK